MLQALKTVTFAALLAGGTLLGLTASPAEAAIGPGTPLVQTVQYYGPPPYAYGRPYYARPHFERPYPRYYARRHWGPPPRPYGRPYYPHEYGRRW